MSMMFRYEFEISPVTPSEVDVVLDAVPYVSDSNDYWNDTLYVFGESTMSGGVPVEERHEEVCKAFPGKKVVTKWRCTEYDAWDDICGDDICDDVEEERDGPR